MLSFKTIVSRVQPLRNRVILMSQVVNSLSIKSIASNTNYSETSSEKRKCLPTEPNSPNQSCQTEETKSSPVETYNHNKMIAQRNITGSLMEESLIKEEEKYQTKLSEIIEIFYSIDESVRPESLKATDVDYMVKMKPRQIRSYIKSMGKLQAKRESMVEYKQEIKEAIFSRPKPELGVTFDQETGKPIYKFHNICPVCSYNITKRMREYCLSRIAQWKLAGTQKIIFDFDYDQYMTAKQHMTITAQVKISMGILKESPEPIELFFCNLKPESPVAQYLDLDFKSLSSNMIEATSKSYLDLFPKERLVYLTADTDNVLKYDPDDIYIIGGMIDTLTNEPLSAIKSQREGLRTAKLPLNDYVSIRNEVKSLKVSQVFGIICQLCSSSNDNMMEALKKYIPFRIRPEAEIDRIGERFEKANLKSRESLKNKFSLTDEETDVMILLAEYYKRDGGLDSLDSNC